MSEWDGPATRYEITVAGDDDVLEEIAVALRAWANPRGRRFFMWRAMPKEAPAAPAAPALDPELRQKIADRLALAYNRNPVLIAELCDEQIDRSGNLLGWLREVARLANPEKP